MAPMTRRFSPGHVPGDDVAEYYRRRAAGGVGTIVTEGIGVDQQSALGDGYVGEHAIPQLHGDRALEGWRRVVQEVHESGGVIFPQLWHQGVFRVEGSGEHPAAPSLRPSGLWGPKDRFTTVPAEFVERVSEPTRPMTDEEIADSIDGFARSAANAREAGFDGVALHGASGYLIDTFLWHETNQRQDRYGGTLRARVQFAVEVVAAVREAVGPDMPIMFRFAQWKQQDFHARIATNVDELTTILGPLADAGVDVFDASTLYYSVPAFEGSELSLAGWAKRITGKPSVAGGGVGLSADLFSSLETGGAEVAENVEDVAERLDRGEFDLVYVGRSLIADPAWPKKVAAGQPATPFDRAMLASLS